MWRNWNPWREMDALRREVDRVFQSFGRREPARLPSAFLPGRAARGYPLINIHEDADSVCVEALAPGLDTESIGVSVQGNVLTVTGEKKPLGFSVYRTLPVDLDGDGCHELVRGVPGGDGEVLDRDGRTLGTIRGTVAMASKFLDRPGEQVLAFEGDGTLRAWADANARDGEEALARYAHPFYKANQRLTSCGYNLCALGGL